MRSPCVIADCERPSASGGLCTTHLYRQKNGLDMTAPVKLRRTGCTVEGCDRRHYGKGLCQVHFDRMRYHGDPLKGGPARPGGSPLQRLLRRVTWGDRFRGTRCMVATTQPGRYAQVNIGGRNVSAHRFMYEQWIGPIPDGLHIDHLCRVRACVNPLHMEPVTLEENLRRGFSPPAINARKTHCINGHPYDEENTYYDQRLGHRHCKACWRERAERRRLPEAGPRNERHTG